MVNEAKLETENNPTLKYIIVCSSRLIEDVSKTMRHCLNCFPKVVVFCGTLARCEQVMKQFGELVYAA